MIAASSGPAQRPANRPSRASTVLPDGAVAPCFKPDDKRRGGGEGQLESRAEQRIGIHQQDHPGGEPDIAKRQAEPVRDWRIDDAEIPPYRDRARLPYVTEVESYRDRVRRMRTWNWLCGLDGEVALRWERSRPVEELLSAR